MSLVLLAVASAAQAGERVALLIGNSAYATPEMSLRNPLNDVEALARALRDLGFVVAKTTDLDAAGMETALKAFGAAAQGAEMAVFFYAGHGVQIGGENHLIGTEFSGNNIAALRRSSITMAQVRDTISRAGPEIGILLLDACRNNPFSDQGLVEQGLVRAKGGAGLLIAYATDPGNVAYDGTGENSVFTSSLLDHLATPGLDTRLMLGRVRQQVVMQTGGRQVPWVEEAVLSEHAFAPALDEDTPDDATASELAHWRTIASSVDPNDFDAYLRDYPNGLFVSIAQDRLDRLSGDTPAMNAAPAETLLASADPQRMTAALTALGLIEAGRARTVQPDLAPALAGYRRHLADGGDVSAEALYRDAAQVSMFLAATTLQRLRTDLVALRSVERTLAIAEDALAQIAEIAETNADALPVLRQAHNDIYDIHRSRGTILRRLDESRSYYDEVLNRAVLFFPPDVTTAWVGGDDRFRDLQQSGHHMTEDAALFLAHVAQADDSKKGSYQWLADLLPQE
ncbi:caspase family protein [Ruegeria sp. 2205SS24-7]|uniref:caspase family protein n=1 Tax=Ruegeria discodermiae TaxID=3064389 RepID=UPI00274104EC|nr:caspase family protein [Ruegeria sp. 2205SS24-7]MDP5219723.1 caspase family protein [Ruegeria sp. 2205SS24-7]